MFHWTYKLYEITLFSFFEGKLFPADVAVWWHRSELSFYCLNILWNPHEPYIYTEKEILDTYIEKFLHWHLNVHYCYDTFYWCYVLRLLCDTDSDWCFEDWVEWSFVGLKCSGIDLAVPVRLLCDTSGDWCYEDWVEWSFVGLKCSVIDLAVPVRLLCDTNGDWCCEDWVEWSFVGLKCSVVDLAVPVRLLCDTNSDWCFEDWVEWSFLGLKCSVIDLAMPVRLLCDTDSDWCCED